MTEQVIVALSTCPDEATARTVAQTLVSERLAACVNRLPGVTSTYFWDGRLQDDPESAETPPKRTIAIPLTREQQLAVAAATGVMVGVLEIDPEALESGELPWGQIPGLSPVEEPDSASPSTARHV